MRIILAGAVLALAATQASATVTGSAFAEYTQGGVGTTTSDDTTLPAFALQGTGFAASNVDFSDEGSARAQQSAAGFSTVNSNALFFSGGSAPDTLIAETVFRESVTNTSGVTQDYSFDIFLKNMYVDIYDYAGAPAGPNPFDGPSDAIGGRISYDVSINGQTVYAFIAEVFGGNAGVSVDQSKGTDGVAPDGSVVTSVFASTSRSEPGSDGGFGFDPFFATLDAGTFADGAQIDLVATMRAEIRAFPFELGAEANIGDPNDLSGSGVGPLTATSAGPLPVVPLPAGAWLLLGGLGALAAMRRRAA